MKKHKDLSPWIDYFQMLRTYEEKGFLQVVAEKREAYITRAALLTLTEPGTPQVVVRALFHYIMYRYAHDEGLKYHDVNSEGPASDKPSWLTAKLMEHARAVIRELAASTFALHIVKEEPPHDLLSTTVLTRSARVWYKPLQPKERFEVIYYGEKPEVLSETSNSHNDTST